MSLKAKSRGSPAWDISLSVWEGTYLFSRARLRRARSRPIDELNSPFSSATCCTGRNWFASLVSGFKYRKREKLYINCSPKLYRPPGSVLFSTCILTCTRQPSHPSETGLWSPANMTSLQLSSCQAMGETVWIALLLQGYTTVWMSSKQPRHLSDCCRYIKA
jgi:hypothetical protein